MIPLRYTIRGLLDVFLYIPLVFLAGFLMTLLIYGPTGSMVLGIVLISVTVLGTLSLASHFGYRLVTVCSPIETLGPSPALFARYRPVLLAFGYTSVVAIIALLMPIPEDDAVFAPFRTVFGWAHLPGSFLVMGLYIFAVPTPWPYLILPLSIYTFYAAGMWWGFRKKGIPSTSRKSRLIASALIVVALGTVISRAVEIRSRVQVVYKDSYFFERDALANYRPYDADNRLVKIPSPGLSISNDHPRLDGATAAYPIYAAAAQAIYAGSEDDLWKFIDSNTTPQAYEKLIKGEVDIIFALQPSPEQRAAAKAARVTLHLMPIAKEAFVHQDNPVNTLTPAQIRSIYTKRIRNWSEAGGTKHKILPFQRPQGSGSQTALQEMVMHGEKPAKPAREEFAHGMGSIIQDVASYQNSREAIGYSFRFFATTMVPIDGIKLLAIDGVPPIRETIRDGTYPYTAELYAITAGTKNPHAQPFIDWFLSPAGQALVEDTGYVSVGGTPVTSSPAPTP